jgi:D-sedoheptulose 7-phosphate isomerase
MEKIFKNYSKNIINQLSKLDLNKIIKLERILFEAWKNNNKVFFCGNGGSAGNANHIANDLFYVINKKKGINTESLASNPAIITCLANDEGYENIFVKQLETKANINDVLIAFSGSGNSKNIIKALRYANKNKIKTVAIVGYDGGVAKKLASLSIHIKVNDMQVSEDFQTIIMHICTQSLKKRKTIF